MKFRLVESPSYGGAYDIRDDQYFTREELNEFGERIAETVGYQLSKPIEYVSAYVENGFIELTLTYDGYDVELKTKLDMRRIGNPQHINKYSLYFVPKFVDEFKNIFRDIGEPMDEDFSYQEKMQYYDIVRDIVSKVAGVKDKKTVQVKLDTTKKETADSKDKPEEEKKYDDYITATVQIKSADLAQNDENKINTDSIKTAIAKALGVAYVTVEQSRKGETLILTITMTPKNAKSNFTKDENGKYKRKGSNDPAEDQDSEESREEGSGKPVSQYKKKINDFILLLKKKGNPQIEDSQKVPIKDPKTEIQRALNTLARQYQYYTKQAGIASNVADDNGLYDFSDTFNSYKARIKKQATEALVALQKNDKELVKKCIAIAQRELKKANLLARKFVVANELKLPVNDMRQIKDNGDELVVESMTEDIEYGVGGSLVVYDKLLREVDRDAETLINEYKKGEKSPSDILNDLGYFEYYDNHHKFGIGFTVGTGVEATHYTKVFDFEDFDKSFGELPIQYWVEKNGKVPHGYTVTKTQLDEGIIRKVAEIKQALKNKAEDRKESRKDITQAKNAVKDAKKDVKAAKQALKAEKDYNKKLENIIDNTHKYAVGFWNPQTPDRISNSYNLSVNKREVTSLKDLMDQVQKFPQSGDQDYAIFDMTDGKTLLDTKENKPKQKMGSKDLKELQNKYKDFDENSVRELLIAKGIPQNQVDNIIGRMK